MNSLYITLLPILVGLLYYCWKIQKRNNKFKIELDSFSWARGPIYMNRIIGEGEINGLSKRFVTLAEQEVKLKKISAHVFLSNKIKKRINELLKKKPDLRTSGFSARTIIK